MANYNANDRSEKILQGKRFTTSDLSVSQEAFTSVLDLSAYEIRTDDGLIPSASNQLPFSGSSQNGLIVSASSVDPGNFTEGSADDLPILKYFYRHRLKRGGAAQSPEEQVYYFTEQEATTSGGGRFVSDNQLLESDQLGDFISAKYLVNSADTVNNAETLTPGSAGYNVVVYVSDSTTASGITEDPSDANNYVFDYKTGVLSWKTGFVPADSKHVYITAYRYIGRTLRSQIDDGTIGGGSGFPFSGSAVITGSLIVSGAAPNDIVDFTLVAGGVSGSFSGSFSGDGSGLTGVVADSVDIPNLVSASSGADNQIAIFKNGRHDIEGSSKLTFDGNTFEVDGDVKANQFIVDSTVTQVTMSFSSGSTIFGDTDDDTHQFTGSLSILKTGSGEFGITIHTSASAGGILIQPGFDGDITGSIGGTAIEATGSLLLTGSIVAQLATDTSERTALVIDANGNIKVGSDFLTESEVKTKLNTEGVISGSSQIATEISGAFTEASAAIASDIATNVTAIALNTAKVGYTDDLVKAKLNADGVLSSSAQIATEISGAFTAASASFSTRVTLNDAKVGYTDAAVTTVINTAGVLSGSAQIATEISGAFTAASASIASDIVTNVTAIALNTAKVGYTDDLVKTKLNTDGVLSGSAQIAAEISGAFTEASAAIASDIATLQGNEVHTAAAISGAINLATASLFNGTPADNQIAVFTDHNTVEGSTFLTFDSSTKLLTVATASITTNLTVGGDLTVNGTTTTVNSTVVNIDDNIIVVNYGGSETDAGIYAVDNVDTTGTGSLIWRGDQDFWSAGLKGAEKRVVTFNADNPTNSGFIHLNDSDEIVSVASGSDVGAFLQKTATGFEVSAIIDGGTY